MKRKTPNLNPDKTCFFICPIDKEGSVTRQRSDQVLQFIVAPAIAKHDLVTIRADQIADPGSIPNQIITHILHDKLVIADLTDHNPNVFYEVALRHAFRKPIIQIIEAGQTAPFDVGIMRTVPYALDLLSATTAKNDIERFVETVLDESYEVESPVTIAAKIEDLTRSRSPESQVIIQSILANIESLSQKLDHISGCVCRTDDLRDSIPPLIKDRVESILGQYSAEIGLLKSLRHAGITGIFKRREMALAAFARALDEESREIMIIGSSLKGLLQKEEYKAIANKIKFKADKKLTNVKFLLTHPIVADFRASQENRRPGEIGKEILASLCILRDWQIPPENVRLYLGTPTCFAIKTTRQMLVNPYPYISVSFDSPCLHLEYSSEGGTERPGYFFDEFNSRHFGAWDTDLAVHITDFNAAIDFYTSNLQDYSKCVEDLIMRGKDHR